MKSNAPELAKNPPSSTQPVETSAVKSTTAQPKIPVPSDATTNSSLVLQAIAWANNPKDRIAVINGQILREGQAIEGITITVIEKDAVILTEGSKTTALAFRIK
jgi:type II secretory pathway component PulC